MNRKRKIQTVVVLVLVLVLMLVTFTSASATTKRKCKSIYSGGAKVAKICYTMNVNFIPDGRVACKSNGWTSKYIYQVGWRWSGTSASCYPSGYRDHVHGYGGSMLYYYNTYKGTYAPWCIAWGYYGTFTCGS